MFSAKKKPSSRQINRHDVWRSFKKRLPDFKSWARPRIGVRIWLTALFVLVTAFAAVTAYEIVRPILEETLNRASGAAFRQVGDQYEDLIEKDPTMTTQRLGAFATSRGLQWGIVQVEENGNTTMIDGNLEDWWPEIVIVAVAEKTPQRKVAPIETGQREDQVQATYASPISIEGRENTAVVFNRFFTTSDIENAQAALNNIERIVLLAGGLALLIAGFSGYVVASLIARRVSRLGVAAERLASGNFDERIHTRIEDEVGALGATFNSMAVSLKGAFGQIEQEKERVRAILDGMTDAVVGVDRDLNPIFLNPRARELLESSDMAFHTRLQEILAKTRYDGPVTEPEAEAGDKVIEIRAAPLEEGALAILRDVTEERRIQRTKAQFIANASHELKTPLFALSGYLEMLEDEQDEKTRADFLEAMRVATERLRNLAKTLLDLSRLDANSVTFRLEEVDLEDLLHELRRDFEYTGRPVNVRIEKDVPPVETDPIQLLRTLTILLDNALKYSEKDSPVDLELHRDDGHAVISVSDYGCGIPESEQPHIFERFYRAQGSSRADGTGLGLALAREITQHLGAEIHVRSKPGSGSTFSVTLPLTERSPVRHGLTHS